MLHVEHLKLRRDPRARGARAPAHAECRRADPDDNEGHGAPEHVAAAPTANQPPPRRQGASEAVPARLRGLAPSAALAVKVPDRDRTVLVSLACHRKQALGDIVRVAHLGERAQFMLEAPQRVRFHPARTARRHVGVRPVKFRAVKLAVHEGGQ
jgi:hypothetical protein